MMEEEETVRVQSGGRSRKSQPTRANYQPEEEDEEEDETEKMMEEATSSPVGEEGVVVKKEADEEGEEVSAVQLTSSEDMLGKVKQEVMEETGEEDEEKEQEENGMDRASGSGSTPNSPRPSGDRERDLPTESDADADAERIDSPSPSEGMAGEEKATGGGSGSLDNLFQILPYWYFLNRAFGLGEGEGAAPSGSGPFQVRPSDEAEQNEEEDGDGEVEEEDRDSSGGSPQSASRLNSILLLESLRQQLQNQGTQMAVPNEAVLQQGIQLSEILSKMSGGAASLPNASSWRQAAHSPTSTAVDPELDDQPLDLTSTRKRDEPIKLGGGVGPGVGFRRMGENSGALPLDKPDLQSPFLLDEETSKVFRSNPRSSKGYTATELQAALHDIQSGKLGTRRAAVIYGIPRSTLRNKVYKLGKDRGRLFPQGTNGPLPHHNNNNSVNHNNNVQSKETPSAGSGGLLSKLSYLQGLSPSSYHLTRSAARFAGEEGEEEGTGAGRRPPFLREPPTLYPVNNGGRDNEDKPTPPKLIRGGVGGKSSLSELISKHHHHQAQTRGLHLHHNHNHPNYQGMEVEEGSSPGDGGEPISLLSQADWKSHLLAQAQHGRGESGGNSSRHHSQQLSHHHHHLHQQGSGGEDPNSLDLAGKKSRPKRGNYRNYDWEALVKAVRAVQNGEMSVHRAGSFFGVPHSTLEYKVKERHLLRRPKRKEVTSPISQSKSSPENSSDATTNPGSRSFPSAPSSSSAQSSFYSKTGPAKGLSSASSSPYLFPLTSDLRESLSRYLNSNSERETESHSEMEVGTSPPSESAPTTSTRNKEETGGATGGPFALEGLIGSRLQGLFQLNDMLIRSSASGGGGSETLDLSKK